MKVRWQTYEIVHFLQHLRKNMRELRIAEGIHLGGEKVSLEDFHVEAEEVKQIISI